jgi:hypothetical protein
MIIAMIVSLVSTSALAADPGYLICVFSNTQGDRLVAEGLFDGAQWNLKSIGNEDKPFEGLPLKMTEDGKLNFYIDSTDIYNITIFSDLIFGKPAKAVIDYISRNDGSSYSLGGNCIVN